VTRAIEQERPEIVNHHAAQLDVRRSVADPAFDAAVNLVGFLNLIEACRQSQVPRLVYASSSSVYGGNTKLPFSVEDRVDKPVSLYAATKRANELIAHSYTHLFGVQTVGLRFFTVYGPWGRPDMAMWLFTRAMLAGQPIQLFNHGAMKRDFTYIDDIIQGVVGCIEAKDLDPYELFNIGNHRSEDLLRLVDILARTLGVEPRVEMLPMQPGDVEATYADTELIRRKIGFEPTTSIDVGIPKFVAWYREYHRVTS